MAVSPFLELEVSVLGALSSEMEFELLILHLHFIDLYIMTDIMNLLGVELRVIIGHFRKRLLLQLRSFNVLARALVMLVSVSVVST